MHITHIQLFQTTKIQIFESNSQHFRLRNKFPLCCFRLQRYKLLKAIHNDRDKEAMLSEVVSDYKDTNFLKAIDNKS